MIAIANCSGFLGDRLAAAREIVDAHREGRAHVDVLTGDWLAELTMGLLARQRERDPAAGYAATFVRQMADVLADCLAAGITVVANAGGLNPHGCAEAVEALGTGARIAVVDGDDVTDRVAADLDEAPVVANAYLGCRGIVAALAAGADVVITGRVTDAAVVVGPAAHRHGWTVDDLDALAGATAAGHVIECGAQATGGNFSFAAEIADLRRPGFPIAEIAADGSAVITKPSGTGGAVTVETVTAQLLYEIDGPRYPTPDVTARFDTVSLHDDGPDRVRLSGTVGEPPPDTVKVGAIVPAGWRNEITLVITGLDVEAKAQLALDALWTAVPRETFERVETTLVRGDREDPKRLAEAVSFLRIAVAGEQRAVARLPRAAVETALGSYPGCFATSPPGPGSAASVFRPVFLPAAEVPQRVTVGGTSREVAARAPSRVRGTLVPQERSHRPLTNPGSTRRVPLGRVVGARSGDKGGNATLGLWARTDAAHAWLAGAWTDPFVADLLGPDAEGCDLRRWALPTVRAVGVTVVGFLGRGVADNLSLDAQAKGLAEFVRARHVDVPEELIP
ncbi:acyclic terpene utilization AtuA family protein [Actinomycetospora sp. CA-084318]|uniref:acyclic terpene utilization AtuA family protein n=1 Tax=Actinomycetospora sp. CA-084318 TaxID=3239892 RepID=UPI003D9684AB